MAVNLKSFRVVLCRPSDGRNVGAVCRAMKNAGLSSLYLVGSEEIDIDRARTLAVHAEDLLDDAVRCETLDDAVSGCGLAVGASRRRGKYRKFGVLNSDEFPDWVADRGDEHVALVFGNETSGLSVEEMQRCHMGLIIPTSSACPSLNLSHAVQIVAYELFCRFGQGEHEGSVRKAVPEKRISGVVDTIQETLDYLGFFEKKSPENIDMLFRDILARAALTDWESDWMEKVFRNIKGHAMRNRSGPDD